MTLSFSRILGHHLPDAARRPGETLISYVGRLAPRLSAAQLDLAAALARDITAVRFAPASAVDGSAIDGRRLSAAHPARGLPPRPPWDEGPPPHTLEAWEAVEASFGLFLTTTWVPHTPPRPAWAFGALAD